MNEKEVFFSLEGGFQKTLRYYMIIFAILQAVESLTSGLNIFWQVGSLGFVILVLYNSFHIKQAPIVYFNIIFLSFWIVAIFDVLKIYRTISNHQTFTLRDISALLSILLIVLASPTLMKYRNAIKESKKIRSIE